MTNWSNNIYSDIISYLFYLYSIGLKLCTYLNNVTHSNTFSFLSLYSSIRLTRHIQVVFGRMAENGEDTEGKPSRRSSQSAKTGTRKWREGGGSHFDTLFVHGPAACTPVQTSKYAFWKICSLILFFCFI